MQHALQVVVSRNHLQTHTSFLNIRKVSVSYEGFTLHRKQHKHGSKPAIKAGVKTNDDRVSLRCTKGQTWIKLIVGTVSQAFFIVGLNMLHHKEKFEA